MKAKILFLLFVATLPAMPGHAQDFLKRVKPWLFPFDSLEASGRREKSLPELFHSRENFQHGRPSLPSNISPAITGSQSYSDSVQAVWVSHYASGLAVAIAVDGSGNVYVTGYVNYDNSFRSYEYATVKYNNFGDQQWVAKYYYNGPDFSEDLGTSPAALIVDAAGNVYVTAACATIKYNASGIEQWVVARCDDGIYIATALAVDAAGNVYVTGSGLYPSTDLDYVTIKYSASGVEEWVVRYNGPDFFDDIATALALDTAGNIYVTGYSLARDSWFDYATVKYNTSGIEQWVARYSGPGKHDDRAIALAVDTVGNVYVTGNSYDSGTSYDYATVKYNASGVEQWVARHNGLGNRDDRATALALDADGNIYVTGYSESSETSYDYATIKYQTSGSEQWIARYNGPGNSEDKATALALDADGNIYVTGYSKGLATSYDYATIKYQTSGIELWVARYNGLENSSDKATAIDVGADGKIYVTGSSIGSNWSTYTTIKYHRTTSFKVTTNAATQVGFTSATFNGAVNPHNLTTTVHFEYGTTPSYGNMVSATPDIVSGAIEIPVSANLSNLFSDTTYHYRIVASNDEETIKGEDRILKTLHCEALSIHHTPPVSPVEVNNGITIKADIFYPCGIDSVALKYRKGGDSSFIVAARSNVDSLFQWIIPDSAVTSHGVEFFITATSVLGTTTTRMPDKGFFSVQVSVRNPGVVNTSAQPAGSEQNAYRLISIPLELENKNLRWQLEEDLGLYDIRKWRLFALEPNQRYVEISDTLQMDPGKAFLLIVKDPGKFIDTGAGTSVRTDQNFEIPLHPEWNFFGNPFNFPIPIKNLSLKSGKAFALRYHEGTWRDPIIRRIEHIQSFEGHAIFNTSGVADTLLINPDLTPAPGGLRKEFSATFAEKTLWSIRMLAQCQEASDEDNIAAIVAGANEAWDEMDQPEPPVIGEYVSVYFPHPEWKKLAKSYCLDARPELVNGEVWEFEVKTNIRDKVNLTFNGIESVPQQFEVWLTDDALRITHNLREKNVYTIAGTQHAKSLKLMVGTKDFIEGKLASVQVIPTHYELSQNFPNPFNPATTIRYGLPRPGRVSLKIFDLLGKEVAALVNEEQKTAGYHVVIWDGRDKSGGPAGSGIYFYRLQTESGFVLTQKLALVK